MARVRKLLLIVGVLAVVAGSSVAAASLHDSSTTDRAVVMPKPSATHDSLVPAVGSSLAPSSNSEEPTSATPATAPPASGSSSSPTLALPTGQPKEVVVIRKDGSKLLDAPISGKAVYDAKTGVLIPQGFGAASWFADGWPMPGQPGPAVVVGHIDNKTGPDVFWNLQDVVVGDKVQIEYSTGFTVTFLVTSVERFDKDNLPKDKIWTYTTRPVLRLITCNPATHFSHGHYAGNIAVYADQEVNAG